MYRAESPSWPCAANAFRAGIASLGGRIYEIPDSDQKEMTGDVGNVDITCISHKEQFERFATSGLTKGGETVQLIIAKFSGLEGTYSAVIDNPESLLEAYRMLPRGKTSVTVAMSPNGSGASMTTAEIPWSVLRAPETKCNELEALNDERMVVGHVKSLFRGNGDTMPPEEDPYAVPSSEPDMEQDSYNAIEPLDEGVFIAPATDDGAEDNKPMEIIEHILDPDHYLVDFWRSIDNDELKKKPALAEERLRKYFDFWRSAEEELTRQIELNDELKKELKVAKAEALREQEGSN
ncbi:hypothetical protein FCOIX_3682 [Fusarium coicis]|nr:hypothetical protein FCOIX_3682 [Fusarium coicis]